MFSNHDSIVKTKYGPIHGFQFESTGGFSSDVFLGIPFATPPVGDLKLEKPVPPKAWSTPLEAKDHGPPCLTFPGYLNEGGQEDCLYLNIVRPRNPSLDPKGYPVMVFIHGGCFMLGSIRDLNYKVAADRLVSKGVIFISIQYRLGSLGFYSTGDETCPGNYGIWDQIQALRFIKEVIKDFGGNPDNVTTFGESAGGASVSIIGLSEEGSKLFSNMICMSGTAHSPWALNTGILATCDKITETLNCCGCSQEKKIALKNSGQIVDALKNFIYEIMPSDSIKTVHFNPRIDGDLLEDFDDFKEIYQKRLTKPTLIGICSFEHRTFCLKNPMLPSFAKVFPIPLEDAALFDESKFRNGIKTLLSEGNPYGDRQEEALNKVIDFYLTQKSNYKKNQYLQAFVQMVSDILFNVPSMREAVEKAETGNDVFFYVYDYDKFSNPFCEGAGHGSDLVPFFGGSRLFPDIPVEGAFEKVVSTFTELFVSFAKDGTPSFNGKELPKVGKNKIPFLHINENPFIGEDLWPERLEFWNSMAKEYNYDWSDSHRK
ncbi:hypothetical protein FO519_006965 [Halicephalobus sp. NKZ332]|nr:hypothetical protein FO519_006965 [Halicephalobus sp. NKZ332]